MKVPDDYVKEVHDGEVYYVKHLNHSTSARVELDTEGNYNAYGDDGSFLGLTKLRLKAEQMATHGHTNTFDYMSTLSLYLAWNDAVASGEVPLEDKDGNQFLGITGESEDIVMLASPDKREGGWTVEILLESEVRKTYGMCQFSGVMELKRARKPYILE